MKRSLSLLLRLPLLLFGLFACFPPVQAFGQASAPPDYTRLRNLPVLDARAYGVKADGSTNDRTAVNNAWNAAIALPRGGVVDLPAGTVDLRNKLKPTAPGLAADSEPKLIWLRGAGVGRTYLKIDLSVANNSYLLHFEGSSGTPYRGIVMISDLSVINTTFGLDGVARINSGQVAGVTSSTLTLSSAASSSDSYYDGETLLILEDSGNPACVGQDVTIGSGGVTYNGTTKVISGITWGAGGQPSASAKYGILLDGSDTDDQKTRGAGRIGFTWCQDGIWIERVTWTGGHGAIDFRACQNIWVERVHTKRVTENSINFLDGAESDNSDDCFYATVANCILESGEGIDGAVAVFEYVNLVIKLRGVFDEGIDFNGARWGSATGCTVWGGGKGYNFHGVTVEANPDASTHDVSLIGCKAYGFAIAGVSVQFGASDGTAQTNTAGHPGRYDITGGRFVSTVSGAKGLELSWTSTSFPVRVDDTQVTNVYVSVSGRAVDASYSKDLTVSNSTLRSSGAEGFYSNHSTYSSENVRVINNRISGITTGGSATTQGAGIWFGLTIRPLAQDNVVTGTSAGYAIKVTNCKNPRIVRNEVMDAAGSGIVVEWTATGNIESDNDLKAEVVGNRVYQFGSVQTGRFGISCTTSSSASGTYHGLTIRDNFVTYTTANSQSRAYNCTAATAGNLTITFTGNQCGDVFAALAKWTLTGANAATSTIGGNRFTSAAGGGFVVSLDGWYQNDLPANQAATETSYYGIPSGTTTLATTRWIAPKAGSITRVWAKASTSVTQGTITITVYKATSSTGFTTTLTTTNPTFNAAIQAPGDDTFVAGDELTIRVTTTSDLLPAGSLDVRCGMDVEY